MSVSVYIISASVAWLMWISHFSPHRKYTLKRLLWRLLCINMCLILITAATREETLQRAISTTVSHRRAVAPSAGAICSPPRHLFISLICKSSLAGAPFKFKACVGAEGSDDRSGRQDLNLKIDDISSWSMKQPVNTNSKHLHSCGWAELRGHQSSESRM